jgi:hypothetical protein
VYVPPPQEELVAPDVVAEGEAVTSSAAAATIAAQSTLPVTAPACVAVPPCDPGNAKIIDGPPAKKQKTRITPTLLVNSSSNPADQVMADVVQQAVTQMTLDEQAGRQKKRIQPTLVSSG